MAKATVKLPDELLSKLSRLGEKTDEIAAMALETGGKVVLDQVRGNLEAVVGSGTKYPCCGELHSTMRGKSLWIFSLGVQLHYAINLSFLGYAVSRYSFS